MNIKKKAYICPNLKSHFKIVQMNNNNLIYRHLSEEIRRDLTIFPVVTLTGPRQSGKTTLCRELFPELPYVNLEEIDTLNRIKEDPHLFFTSHPEGAVIDIFDQPHDQRGDGRGKNGCRRQQIRFLQKRRRRKHRTDQHDHGDQGPCYPCLKKSCNKLERIRVPTV